MNIVYRGTLLAALLASCSSFPGPVLVLASDELKQQSSNLPPAPTLPARAPTLRPDERTGLVGLDAGRRPVVAEALAPHPHGNLRRHDGTSPTSTSLLVGGGAFPQKEDVVTHNLLRGYTEPDERDGGTSNTSTPGRRRLALSGPVQIRSPDTTDDYFGEITATDGETILVSVRRGVYFHVVGSCLFQRFTVPGRGVDGGLSVCGDWAIVGAQYLDSKRGAAYIYSKGADGYWTMSQKLTDDYGESDDRFGFSVGISCSDNPAGPPPTAVVGAYHDRHPDYPGQDVGSVVIFAYDADSGSWIKQQKITNPVPGHHQFGNAVAVDGPWILVGAHLYADTTGDDDGRVYVYKYNPNPDTTVGEEYWVEAAESPLADPDSTSHDFGFSVAIYGDQAIVGNIEDHAYMFFFDETTSSWVIGDKIEPPTQSAGESNEFFGARVSLIGDTVVVGDFGATVSNVAFAGAAYIYKYDSLSDAWAFWEKINNPTGSDMDIKDDEFAKSVAIGGSHVVIGVPNDNDNDGSVLIYSTEPDGICTDCLQSDGVCDSAICQGNVCGCGVSDVDTDNDGSPDCIDACEGFDDNLDSDNDGVPDDCDVCIGNDATGDSDGDGVCDDQDPCPLANPDDAGEDGFCDNPASSCPTPPSDGSPHQLFVTLVTDNNPEDPADVRTLRGAIKCSNLYSVETEIRFSFNADDSNIVLTSPLDSIETPVHINGEYTYTTAGGDERTSTVQITGSRVFLVLSTGGGSTIENLGIANTGLGTPIQLEASNSNIIRNTYIKGSDTALLINGSHQTRVEGNTIEGASYQGVRLDFSSGNTIIGNTIIGSKYCLALHNLSDDNQIGGNTMSGCTDAALYATNSNQNRIEANTIEGALYHGVRIESSAGYTIVGNTITNSGYCLAVYLSSGDIDTAIRGNTMSGCTKAIRLVESSQNTVDRNNIDDSTDGIEIKDSDYAVLHDNSILGSGRGIVVISSTFGQYVGNTLTGNRWGG